MANPDGTKQVSPPTRSAFDPPAGKPEAEPPKAADSPKPEHSKSLFDSLKNFLGMGGEHTIQEGGKDVNSAVDDAVKGAPGNNADY